MKLSAKGLRIKISDTGIVKLTFECSRRALEALQKLKEGDYELSITQERNKRSHAQNRYLWELIGQICMIEDGNTSGDMELYCRLLEMASIKCVYMLGLPEIRDELAKTFRAVKVVDDRMYNGRQMYMYKCYFGSSHLDTKEMAALIDKTIEYAEQVGIDTDYWKEKFYREK